MKIRDLPAGASFFDVDGIPVARLPDGTCTAYSLKDGAERPYPNVDNVRQNGDSLTANEFDDWLTSGKNKFDR